MTATRNDELMPMLSMSRSRLGNDVVPGWPYAAFTTDKARRRCLANHSQDPETLRRRGGLSPAEAFAILSDLTFYEAMDKLGGDDSDNARALAALAEIEKILHPLSAAITPLLRGPRVHSEPVWVLVISPEKRGGTAVAVSWRGTMIDEDVANVGSLAGDLGLDDAPGDGAWVFEGTLVAKPYRSNHPLDPEEWDVTTEWKGTWRRPTADELVKALLPEPDPTPPPPA